MIFLAKTSLENLTKSSMLLNYLAEIRRPQDTATTILELENNEQKEWVDELDSRISYANGELPYVCLIDTGVNNGHKLLKRGLRDADMWAYNDDWGTFDSHPYGHGTGMAGIALYGDLFPLLRITESIELIHRLESIKLKNSQESDDPELWGWNTQSCIYKVEAAQPTRKRINCLALSSDTNIGTGAPSSWSAAVDQVTFGEIDNYQPLHPRLIVIAAGNIEDPQTYRNYPQINEESSIHDPAQSWNSITIGGYTQKTNIDTQDITSDSGDLEVIAPYNGLAPSSTTSKMWTNSWPIKPDIVLEAGNYARSRTDNFISCLDSLSLLTTHSRPFEKQFAPFTDTSAAAAEASRYCAIIQYHYKSFWPETIRALLIHSALWTDKMMQCEKNDRLKKYGYGVPDLKKGLWSQSNYATIVIESNIKPFKKKKSEIKTNEMNTHQLPWPKETFNQFTDAKLKLKITLSYFIEPNPAQRKYVRKYAYASHGLRFNIKRQTETLAQFKKRVNSENRDDEENEKSKSNLKWVLGTTTRNKGSIHSDELICTGPELANMDYIAIYPVSGWWRYRKMLERYENSVRYSLIISLEVENPDIDIYTPIYNIVEAKTPIVT